MFTTFQLNLNLGKLFRSCNYGQSLLVRKLCNVVPEEPSQKDQSISDVVIPKKSETSKAMKAYLERAKEHEEFMKQQNYEFQIGKRHLANMMGEDPDSFTQEDIDNAIQYLFPSGLYDKKARPHMKPPEQVFPQRKAAEFDQTGRPHHFLFYTGNSNFNQLLFNIVEKINELNKFEDAMIRKDLHPDPNLKLDMTGYQWLDREALEKKLLENISDIIYKSFTVAIERLVELPYSYRMKDFVLEYSKPLMNQTKSFDIPKLQVDENGKSYITTYECLRKRARGHVTLRSPGDGIVTINGQDITYFKETQCREQLLFPLIFTNMLHRIDVEAHVEGGGPSGQAGAVRWGISWGLRSFVDEEMLEKMRLAGLLTRDYRTRERKKPGQEGARRKYTWKKR